MKISKSFISLFITLAILTTVVAGKSKKDGPAKVKYTEKPKVVQWEGTMMGGMRNGAWKEYFHTKEKKLKSEGSFMMDKKSGLWKYYDEANGKLVNQVTFKDGKQHGEFISFYPDGKENSRFSYVNGTKEGKVTKLYNTGEKYLEGTFTDHKKSGPWTYYYKDGKVKEVFNWAAGKREGNYDKYDPEGNKIAAGTYKNDEKEGAWETYEKGILRASFTLQYDSKSRRSKTNGMKTVYDENGKLSGKIPYVNGLKEGMEEAYHPNGQKKTVGLNKMNKRTEEWKFYYDNGVLHKKFFYKNDKKEDMGYTYYKNTKLESQGTYKLGKKQGLFDYYDEKGNLDRQITHKGLSYRGTMIIYENGKKKYEFIARGTEEEEIISAQRTPVLENITGLYIEYHPDGTTEKIRGQYSMGDKKGQWAFKDAAGNVTKTETWKMGELVPSSKDGGKMKFGF